MLVSGILAAERLILKRIYNSKKEYSSKNLPFFN